MKFQPTQLESGQQSIQAVARLTGIRRMARAPAVALA